MVHVEHQDVLILGMGTAVPADLQGHLDERFAHALASRRMVDHDLVQSSLDPEGRRVDDHGGGADDGVALLRNEQRHRGVGDEALQPLHVWHMQVRVELRQKSGKRRMHLWRDLVDGFDPHFCLHWLGEA